MDDIFFAKFANIKLTKMFRLLVLTILFRSSLAVIYSLNETEYIKMPPLYGLDEYTFCLAEPGGIYCLGDYGLYGKGPLMDMIKGYSAHTLKHYNHTQIHRGICVTKTCKHFLNSNDTNGIKKTLEACLNDTIYRDYKLQVRLENVNYCKRAEDKTVLDDSDVGVGAVYLIIIILNVIGTLYDERWNKDEKKGNAYLLAFSVRRNWRRLVAPSGGGSDPRVARLQLFHGFRTMTIICVIFSHTSLIIAYSYLDNPLYIEKSYDDPGKQLIFNGTLVVHTFFVISSFLMAYNLMMHEEKHGISLWQWPKGVLLRWIRLSPGYALVLATISTWMRHLGSGPLWDHVVTTESNACRQYWWAHLLFINNYIYKDYACAPQTWYLAADTQLFCFGLLICLIFRTGKSRLYALGTMLTIGFLIVAGYTYFLDLDAVVLQSPETYRNLYKLENTFRLVYIAGHTNISSYSLGLTTGFLTYYLQNQKKNFVKNKLIKILFWAAFPLGVLMILTGIFFYTDGAPVSTAARVLYATFYKTIFQLLVLSLIMGIIFKVDTVYRSIVEWRGFTWTGRVSYSAFLLHTLFQRGLMGSIPRPAYATDYVVMTYLCATIFLTFAGAAMMFVFLESPCNGITKAVLSRGRGKREEDGNRV